MDRLSRPDGRVHAAERARLVPRQRGGRQAAASCGLVARSAKKGPPAFPAQHAPDAASQVAFAEIPGGARLTCTGLTTAPDAVLVQELTVEPGTGDLVIGSPAAASCPGVFGIGFSLLNLRPDIGFAVPYFGGQRFGAELGRMRGRLRLANLLGAPAWSWAKCPTAARFSSLPMTQPGPNTKLYNSDAAQGLGFEACAQWPYADRREVAVCTWRFNTFAGGWVLRACAALQGVACPGVPVAAVSGAVDGLGRRDCPGLDEFPWP